MAESGAEERAAAGSGEVEPVAGSGEVERAVAGSGEVDLSPLHSLDYPCTARLRLRRLLAYLRGYGCREVYQAARSIMPVVFHTRDLVKMVQEGRFRDAFFYVGRFSGSVASYEIRLLVLFLQDLMILNNFAEGRAVQRSCLCDWMRRIHKKPVLEKYPCFATVVDCVLSKRNDRFRAFVDWQIARKKAAKLAQEMAYKVPELRERMCYPRGRSDLYHVVPVGSSRRVKKNVGRKQSTDIAQYYLQMNKRLPSSTQEANRSDPELRGEPLLTLFETSLEAGKNPGGVPRAKIVRTRIDPSSLVGKFNLATIQGEKDLMNAISRQLELQSKLDASKRRSSVASAESNSTLKRKIFQESCLDTSHPGNNSKRPRTSGSFGEDQSPSFEPPHSLVINQGTV